MRDRATQGLAGCTEVSLSPHAHTTQRGHGDQQPWHETCTSIHRTRPPRLGARGSPGSLTPVSPTSHTSEAAVNPRAHSTPSLAGPGSKND